MNKQENVQVMQISEQENVQVVQQMYTAFGEGNLSSLLHLVADDVEWSIAKSEYSSQTGTYIGHEQVVQVLTSVGDLELQQLQPQEIISQGEQVVVIGHALGRLRSTNHAVEYDWVHVFNLRDSKIMRFRAFFSR
ncbi:nuclear transport factor 2 family protein [Coleofasciculus sp. F4-SAH-05]|uniref:nuclear transport factor 2 family protein n=1 Tax=Coleofasciculus sp. F4-SAH-05 TaxID=3069525 RepID=UPI0033016A4B